MSGCITVNAGDGSWTSSTVRREMSTSLAQTAAVPMKVSTANGGITIESGGSGEVKVAVVVRAKTQERADAVTLVTNQLADGTLEIGVQWPDGKRHSGEGATFTITTPGVTSVEAATSNGPIKLANLSGPATVRTSNGGIDVSGQSGDITAKTSNGAVTLANVTGKANVQTSNGSITVKLSPESAGPVDLSTSNGAVRLTVGSAFVGRIKASTSNGRISASGMPTGSTTEIQSSKASVTLPQGGEESVIRTSNGQITIAGPGASD